MKIFKYRVLNHLLFWLFIFAFYTVPFLLSYGFGINAFINLIYLPFDILMVYFVIGFLIPQFLIKKRRLILFILGTAAAIAVNILIAQFIKYDIQPQLGFWVIRRPFVYDMFYALLTNFMIVGMASALKLFSYSLKFQIKQSELLRRSIQSELGVLRSQVNPHFLFNVLNNIDSLIYEDKEKASNALFLLSKIMRYMLRESTQENVMLDNEIEYIRDYLELAKLSFEDDNFVEFKIEGNTSGKKIQPLLFIPIIENAVKHCNKKVASPGIKIAFKVDEQFIGLKTSNHIKQTNFELPARGSGTGLKNVERRLKLLHNDNFTFEKHKNLDIFEVDLKVPLV